MAARDGLIATIVFRRQLGTALFALLSATSALAQTSAATRSDIIGPGDVLKLRIWREPDMSGEFQVASNGTVVLPRLGQLNVSSMPAASLQAILTDKYKVFLNN